MANLVFLLLLLGLMAASERIITTQAVRSERGRNFIINHRWLHPNPICIYRIPMGFVSALIWGLGFPFAGTIFFGFWMMTDMTDGTIARGCDLGTTTGEWLDPLSDKLMYLPVLFMLTFIRPEGASPEYATLSLTAVILFMIFDIASQASRLFVQKKAANSFGKAKTMMICITIAALSLQYVSFEAYMSIPILNQINPTYLMWSCVILGFLSFYCKIIPDHWYANSLTLMNFICGVAAIPMVLVSGNIVGAFILIFIGQFFDLLDGRTARKFGSTEWGALFDDFADGTSFGLAISVIIFVTLKPLSVVVAGIIAAIYFICVVYRLYYFIKNKDINIPGIFIGMPSPAGAMLAGSSALLFHTGGLAWVTLVTTLVASGLMVSKIEYKHFGQKIMANVPTAVKLTLFAIMLSYITILVKEQDELSIAFAIFTFSMIWLYIFVGVNFKKKNK